MALEQRSPHAVLVALPGQGHINPFMSFAKLIAARGFFVTFINTEWSQQRMFKSSKEAEDVRLQLQQQSLNIRFLSVPDGLPKDHPRLQNMCEYLQALEKLAPPILGILQTTAHEAPPITCIVTDFMACTHQVATSLGVPRVVFWTFCASAAIAVANSKLLLQKGLIPVKVKEARLPEKRITCLPGKIPPLWPTDLQGSFREGVSKELFEVMLYESEMQNKADYVLVNVCEELEGAEAVAGLSNGCPALTIGPVFLPQFLKSCRPDFQDAKIETSLWEEDLTCLKWLDTQSSSSILYVSFGSIVVMSVAQLHELALGLEASQQAFLWVLRPDIAEGKSAVLPEGFMERIEGRGMVVQWAPQLKVLSHPSVGGFLTHNGWNSTSESISLGIPMIGWPLRADQFHNCRFCKEIWKVGMDFESRVEDENVVVKKDEVERVVRAMMEGQQGKELRQKAARLREAAVEAVMPGGSSYTNLDIFAHDMAARANSDPPTDLAATS